MFILRLCAATLSSYIFTQYMPNPAYLLYRLSPYWNCWSEYCQEQWYWYDELAATIRFVTAALWVASWAFLEVRSFRRLSRPTPKLLTHLRYGPIAVLVLSVATILVSDTMLIQISRWRIVSYIHSDAPVRETPSLKLYNNYRHWCGNGMAANLYDLYGATPAAYLDDPDPAIRARALQASMYVYDWINDQKYGPSITALKKAKLDPDPMVKDLAAKFNVELYGK